MDGTHIKPGCVLSELPLVISCRSAANSLITAYGGKPY
jgi:hypothetical protein